jgi:hypothetical protein
MPNMWQMVGTLKLNKMSQTETHFGKLRRVVFPEGQTLEQWCEAKCNELGKTELSSWCKTWYEQLRDVNDEDVYFANDELWETIEDFSAEEGDDIYQMHLNENGTVTYVMQFYNGGTCLSECIEESLARLERPNNTQPVKDLAYWKANAEEDYLQVPISVLRYISELESALEN